jgi:hypothetical protein
VRHLNLPDGWQYETAALLSQIGHVAIPDDLFERMAAGEELPAEQLAMLNRHPEVARDLIQRIPRLQAVADMVYHQRSSAKPTDQRTVVLGGRILAAALDFEELLSVGATREQALDALEKAGNKYDRRVLDALATTVAPGAVDVVQVVSVLRLRVEMVILEDVRDTDNHVIVGRGHTVTEGSLQRLCNHAKLGQLGKTEFRVQVPQTGSRAARPSAA